MNSCRRLLAALGLAATAVASAPGLAQAQEGGLIGTLLRPAERRFGAMVDVGFPDGANASLVYRPFYWLRAHGGLGYNLISHGVRAGASIVPLPSWFSPSLTLEAGHYFEGDANAMVRRFDADHEDSALLERVGYTYANAQVGLNFGSKWATFYIQGGITFLNGSIHGISEQLDGQQPESTTVQDEAQVSAQFVSARVGVIFYFLP
jgi:hypothetical protein